MKQNDPSFPEEELDSWEAWCETDVCIHSQQESMLMYQALVHLPMWDQDATSESLRTLLQAILEIGIKPHFLPLTGSASGENYNWEEEVRDCEGLERAVRAIIAMAPM